MQLHNATEAASSGNLVARPMGGGEPRTFGYALAARETRDLSATIDISGFVTADLVGLTGALPQTSVRIFNDAGERGRNGLTVTFIPVSKAITSGKRSVLIAPDDTAFTRLNIGIRALGEGASIVFTLRRADGTVVAEVPQEVAPNVLIQAFAPALFGKEIENNDAIDVAVAAGQPSSTARPSTT